MLASPTAPAQYNELEYIDHNLGYLSKLYNESTPKGKQALMRMIDKWLDKRCMIQQNSTKTQSYQTSQ